ncbi:leucyl aminopeptidase [Clostridium tarantellae]|uniref:Probable cytosol aminopeptidase n=1 Tax=Clostridium tarantellae TaxID=39493 RepID=A0A6I1MJ50_9CLOT|nr:leucyl aminopeptidase [Clostridium tarantellae]MPQ42187.1 leucyl aminopeptidase [Clostridium tarantellae]
MYNVWIKRKTSNEVDTIVLPLFEEKLQVEDKEINKKLARLKNKDQFKGSFGEIAELTRNVNDVIQDVIILGLGKEEDVNREKLRRAFGKVQKTIEKLKSEEIFLEFININNISVEESLKIISEGLNLSAYKFDKYKKNKSEQKVINIYIDGQEIDDIKIKDYEKSLDETNNIVKSIYDARDIVNEPANVIYPETLGIKAIEFGEKYNFEVEIFNDIEIEALGMDAFLSVGKGSDNKPRLIIMRYFGDEENKDKKIGLVGKGITYDAGGYSIKSTEGMVTMKADMGGAATVIGAMCSIAKNKLKANVIAVVAACENLISGHAYKPGDIINSMAGKTIEVLNTDAEGRLTLIDAITYIIRNEKVNEVIDVATLTGAAVVSLGTDVTAVVTNNNEFYNELKKATDITGEKMWQMPNFDDYKKLIESDIADLKNIGGKYAGAITAGLFVGEFVENKSWLHLDIAGPAYIDSSWDYCVKGATGAGIRTLYELIKNRI